MLVLSHYQARALLEARARGEAACDASADLGRGRQPVGLTLPGAAFAGGLRVSWEDLDRIAHDDSGCWQVTPDGVERIQQLSPLTARLASLYPTPGPPALLLSGALMHRIKGVDPLQDALLKLAPLGRLDGQRLLDTATGLGYTAVEAARRGARVITVELDPAVEWVARRNPWSAELFAHPGVERLMGDVAELVAAFSDGAFDAVLHDPPVFQLAGDLYGGAFYRQLRRVLARGGRLFHYIGDPGSATSARLVPGVMRRLYEAGFEGVRRVPQAFGVSARR